MAAPVTSGSSYAPPLAMGTRVQLSIMMFLQFAIWGAWFVPFGNRLSALGLGDYIGSMFGTMALGSIFAPIIVGQIADRYFASEKLMGILHILGAGLLVLMSQFENVTGMDKATVEAASWKLYGLALLYALVYSPTLALSNSVAFTHVPDGQRDFPGLRVLGTIGWIAVGLFVGKVMSQFIDSPATSAAPMQLAAGLSLFLGIYSFFLPKTPPTGKPGDALPFLKALNLFKSFSFAVFFGASFLITIVLAFYYNYTGVFLEKKHGITDVSSTMAIGQIAEMVILPFLPLFLVRFGMKWVLALGMLCWGIRYLCFSQAPTDSNLGFGLVIFGIALHGICFDFFFAAGFIHVDKEAPPEIRGSAQALFTFLTYGLGMWLGSEFSGRVSEYTTITVNDEGKVTDWEVFWLVPAVGVLTALSIFVLFFRNRTK
jgi:nucleoside transporter